MEEKTKKSLPAWLILTIISMIAALGLGLTNMATKDVIAQRANEEKQLAMKSLIPDATNFEEIKLEDTSKLDTLDTAKNGDNIIGYIAQITKVGYGGPMQIIVATNNEFNLLGISVGGPDFAETAGLGSFVKDEKFTKQYIGKATPIVLNTDVDQISGATISSTAVNNGVNEVVETIKDNIKNK